MLFNSLEYIVFLPLVFLLYWFVFARKLNHQNVLLLVASYVFYAWWSWKFLGLLVLITFLDYCYGFWVASENPKKSKLFLWLSVINNLGILAIFKYYNFFVVQFQSGLELLGFHTNPVLLKLALPIGISFYTFHGMSYVFDIYRGKQKPIRNFVDYAVFVSFFPLLVAGPIERANHLLPQIQNPRKFSLQQAVEGSKLILWGMFKKVVIADTLAETADFAFNHYASLNGFALLLGVLAFSFQIYGDFSGYSDIALGTAKLFGFELLSNFRFPYFSRDVAEFWRRWHISLSSWFKDYLYIPLGGSKQGKSRTIFNTFVIFIVSGFWHGASWNFIVWGAIHALGFLPILLLNRNRHHLHDVVAQNSLWPSLTELRQMITTFAFVSFAWIFFRAKDLHHALQYIQRMLMSFYQNPSQILNVPIGLSAIVYITVLLFGDWLLRRNERSYPLNSYLLNLVLAGICCVYFIKQYLMGSNASFIYFQF